jgi:hypothetical protein
LYQCIISVQLHYFPFSLVLHHLSENLEILGRFTEDCITIGTYHLIQILRVAEEHVLKNNLLLRVFFLMASAPLTTDIVDFSMQFGQLLSCNKIDERALAILPFPDDMILQAGLIVVFHAAHIAMRGGLPRIDVSHHVVANSAEV